MERTEIALVVEKIVNFLVEERYDELFANDIKKAITGTQMRNAIYEYGGILTAPPTDAFFNFDIYEVSPFEFSVDFNLWIDLKKSDLTLGCSIYKDQLKIYYSIDNIHVL